MNRAVAKCTSSVESRCSPAMRGRLRPGCSATRDAVVGVGGVDTSGKDGAGGERSEGIYIYILEGDLQRL